MQAIQVLMLVLILVLVLVLAIRPCCQLRASLLPRHHDRPHSQHRKQGDR